MSAMGGMGADGQSMNDQSFGSDQSEGGCEPSSIAETFRSYDSNPRYNIGGHGQKRINEAAQLLSMDDLNALFDIFTKADMSGDGVCSKQELI